MSIDLNRRQLGALGLGAAVASVLPFGLRAQENKRLRFVWWGGENRAKRTIEAVEVYKKAHPGLAVDAESLGWDAYWPRLTTQMAGGNPPDVVQMDYQYIFEYARRGALYPLDEFRSGVLQIDDFGESNLKVGSVDGKLYGVTFGVNSDCFMFDETKLAALGLPKPELTWTWTEYADLAVEITKATPEGYYGSSDPGATSRTAQTWMRQQGKELYTEGKLGCDLDDVEAWFAFVDDLRQRKGCVPADIQALDPGESITESVFTLRKCALDVAGSNMVVAFAGVVDTQIGITMHPHGGEGTKPGQWIGPSMLLSVTPSASDKQACAEFIHFLVESKEAADVLEVERGVPPSASMRDYLSTQLSPVDKMALDYVSSIADKVGPLPPPPPSGANEVEALLIRTNAEIGFGSISVSDGAKEFFEQANQILGRA